jgi:hypothetical protein
MGIRSGSRELRRAWACLILVPVGIVLAFVIGEVLPGLLGAGWTHEESLPMPQLLLVAVPTTLLFCVPGLLAGWFGLRARAEGEAVGLVPAIVGLVVAGYFLLSTAIALVFGPLVG